ncbi:MAG: dephospho-CoA kinase [Burkholderiaceae bacterium]
MQEQAPRPADRAVPIIGLTGGIGSGKSTVADLLVAQGAALVDTDRIAHVLTGPGGGAIDAIRSEFGADMISADGRMDRNAMRALAFSDPMARRRLEAILHPRIRSETDEGIRQALASGAPYILVAVPLLVEGGRARERFERILVVDCPEEVQIDRVMKRSGLDRDQVLAIMASQARREQRLAVADDVVDNHGSLETLRPQIERLDRLYRAGLHSPGE